MAYNKYEKLHLEGSQDGINWEIVEPRQFKKGEVIAENSADCGGSGQETRYRWVTVPNEHICINNDKYSVIKKQVYNNNTGKWEDVAPIETTYGDLIEADSGDCGFGEQWVDTDRWECASVEGMYATHINIIGGGSCYWSYSGGAGVVGDGFYLDTTGGSFTLEARYSDKYYPLRYMEIDGVQTLSSVVTLQGNADHNVVMSFYENPAWFVERGENYQFITKNRPPLRVEDGSTVMIGAQPTAPAVGGGEWAFNHWSVGNKTYYTNPLELVVTSDCKVDLYYDNESVKTGYTLMFELINPQYVEISNRMSLTPSDWFFDSDWHIRNTMTYIGTTNASPSTLEYIGSSCFCSDYKSFASYLMSASFGTARTVYNNAFSGLQYLQEVSLPRVQTIHSQAFKNCIALSRISLPRVQTIHSQAFYGCTQLQSVYLMGSQVCSIANNIFTGCTQLKQILVPASLYNTYKTTWTSWTTFLRSY